MQPFVLRALYYLFLCRFDTDIHTGAAPLNLCKAMTCQGQLLKPAICLLACTLYVLLNIEQDKHSVL